ncbi:MAG: hypothetical protein HKN03_11120 [Acidimicrobiales bacterium]|nr:hypothetical protein [Acidimicrobiales bacterium]
MGDLLVFPIGASASPFNSALRTTVRPLSHPRVMLVCMTFTYVPAIDLTDSISQPEDSPMFSVRLTSGRVVEVLDATTYEPEGPLTTFFRSGSSSRTIDVWSVRVASFRTADIVSIRQVQFPTRQHPSAQNVTAPVLSVVAS